jgi:hypothetical protein
LATKRPALPAPPNEAEQRVLEHQKPRVTQRLAHQLEPPPRDARGRFRQTDPREK